MTQRFPELRDALENPNTIILFPSPDSIAIEDLPLWKPRCLTISSAISADRTCIVIDGTWPQAKEMLAASPDLRLVQYVRLQCEQVRLPSALCFIYPTAFFYFSFTPISVANMSYARNPRMRGYAPSRLPRTHCVRSTPLVLCYARNF
jgi:hypothetical protein